MWQVAPGKGTGSPGKEPDLVGGKGTWVSNLFSVRLMGPSRSIPGCHQEIVRDTRQGVINRNAGLEEDVRLKET